MKKIIIGLIVISVFIIGSIIVLSAPRYSVYEKCINTTEPLIFTPVQVYEGAIYAIHFCGLNTDHVYQLRENNYITTDIWFTGTTNYTIYRNTVESSFIDSGVNKGLLYITLWDNTTQQIIDKKVIALIQHGGLPIDFFLLIGIPLVVIGIIFASCIGLYRTLTMTRRLK